MLEIDVNSGANAKAPPIDTTKTAALLFGPQQPGANSANVVDTSQTAAKLFGGAPGPSQAPIAAQPTPTATSSYTPGQMQAIASQMFPTPAIPTGPQTTMSGNLATGILAGGANLAQNIAKLPMIGPVPQLFSPIGNAISNAIQPVKALFPAPTDGNTPNKLAYYFGTGIIPSVATGAIGAAPAIESTVSNWLAPAGNAVAGNLQRAASYVLPKLASSATEGAMAGGSSNSDAPLQNALMGGAGAPIGMVLGKAGSTIVKGIKAATTPASTLASSTIEPIIRSEQQIEQSALESLMDKADQGAILSPQEAQENFTKNYTDSDGNPLPVDIGTVVNSPEHQALYQSLQYSNVPDRTAALTNAVFDKKISDLDSQIAKTQIIPDVQTKVPDTLDEILGSNPIKNADSQTSLNDIQTNYNRQKQIANQQYSLFDDPNIRFDSLPKKQILPNYTNAANDMIVNQENMKNAFGGDDGLASAASYEVNKAKNILDSKGEYSLQLPDLIRSSQNLSALARAATGQTKFDLGKLATALDQDIPTMLESVGQNNLAAAYPLVKQNYLQNVVPYWANASIRNAAVNGKLGNVVSLAKAVLHPDNAPVLAHATPQTKNNLLYKIVTNNKGNSDGTHNMDATQISNAYKNIPVDLKKTIASFNPDFDKTMQIAPKALRNEASVNKLIEKRDSLLQQKADIKQSSPKYNTMGSLPHSIGDWVNAALNPHEQTQLALRFNPNAARRYQKVLSSDSLRNKYFQYVPGSRKPVPSTSRISPNVKNAIGKTALKGAQNFGVGLVKAQNAP